MKVLLILAALFAFSQANSVPVTVLERSRQVAHECIKEKNADAEEIRKIIVNDILPTDNAAFTEIFVCYWTKLDLMNANGEFNELQMKVMGPHVIKEKLPNLENPEKVMEGAIEHCRDTTGETIGLKAIKFRNCLVTYAKSM